MPTYIILLKVTQQGIKTIEDLPKRLQEARGAIEKVGGKLLDWNLTMGPYDAVAKVEFPDDYTAATVILTIDKLGQSTTTTMKAFSEAEMRKIVEKIS